MSNNTLVKVVAGAAVAVAVGAGVYYLFRESNNDNNSKSDIEQSEVTSDVPLEKFIQILDGVLESQKTCTELVHNFSQQLSQERRTEKLTFLEAYDMVKDLIPEDPITTGGFTMQQFDALIAMYDSHPEVTVRLERILRASNPPVNADRIKNLKKKDIIEIYNFMLESMTDLYNQFVMAQSQGFVADPKVTILAVQTIISTATEERYGVGSSDVEAAAAANQRLLVNDVDYTRPSMMLQQLLASFMGAQVA